MAADDAALRRRLDRQELREPPVPVAASVWALSGRITLVLGRNGCGKSTLLRIGAGELPADHGVVRLAGEAYARPRLHVFARRGLFYLPDRGLLSRRLTLRRHAGALTWRFGPAGDDRVLDTLDVRRFLDAQPGTLSGGERRRSEVALAAMRRPRCLLADEPLAGIGPTDAEVVANAIHALARDGCAVVVTGHEVPQLLALADDVIWMTAATTHGLGTPALAVRHGQFQREYMGPPTAE